MKINIHIERLVLDGFDLAPGEGRRVQASFEEELRVLLATGGIRKELASGIAVPSVPAGTIPSPNGTNPRQLGRQIARAVHAGIGTKGGNQ